MKIIWLSYPSIPSSLPSLISPFLPFLLSFPTPPSFSSFFCPSSPPHLLLPPPYILTRARWDHLHSAAIARQSSLEESLLSLGQFEEAYDELWAWLTDALKQLAEMEPITGDPDAVAAQLSKHKVCTCLD